MKELFILVYIHPQFLKANWALPFPACHNKPNHKFKKKKKTICGFDKLIDLNVPN
jgi:hypothetical protein